MGKTSIFFSNNTSSDVKKQILMKLGSKSSRDVEKYLGLPTLVGESKYNTLRGLKEKVLNKVHS